jgi:hypothetical protein
VVWVLRERETGWGQGSERGATCGRAVAVTGPAAASTEVVGGVELGEHTHRDGFQLG